jgi:hypothetical protein
MAFGLTYGWVECEHLGEGRTFTDPDCVMKAVTAVYFIIRALDNWTKDTPSPISKENWKWRGLKSP